MLDRRTGGLENTAVLTFGGASLDRRTGGLETAA